MAHEVISSAAGVDTTAQVVVGLFTHASDAHAALAELRAQRFSSNQIGAAFRTRANDAYLNDTGSAPLADSRLTDSSLTDSSISDSSHLARPVDTEQESWWNKVKDAFRGDEATTEDRVARPVAVEPDRYSRSEHEYDYADNDFQGSLAGAGISAERAASLTRSLEPDGAIVTVRDAARIAEAEQILAANNGRVRHEDIADTYDDRRPVAEPSAANAERMQLFGEVLRVHKDRISRGEVRVRKDVITENQTMEVPVVREELVLERVAVAGNTPASSASIGGDQEVRVPLSEEKVRLEKQAVVREEVLVGKRSVADVETVSGDVRHEELRVDSDLDTPRRAVAAEELPDDLRRRG